MKPWLRAIGWHFKGPELNHDHPYQFEVEGLPDGERASIAYFHPEWLVLRTTDGRQGIWQGGYETPEDALVPLVAEVAAGRVEASLRRLQQGAEDWYLERHGVMPDGTPDIWLRRRSTGQNLRVTADVDWSRDDLDRALLSQLKA